MTPAYVPQGGTTARQGIRNKREDRVKQGNGETETLKLEIRIAKRGLDPKEKNQITNHEPRLTNYGVV